LLGRFLRRRRSLRRTGLYSSAFAGIASRLTAPAERSRPMRVTILFAKRSGDPFRESDAGLRAPACLAFDKRLEAVAKLGAERGHADAIAIELRRVRRFLQFDDEETRPDSAAAMDDHIGHDSGVTFAVAPPRAVVRKPYGLDDVIAAVVLDIDTSGVDCAMRPVPTIRVRSPGRRVETRVPPETSTTLTRSDRRMQTVSLIGESRRSCAEFINPLRCFGLRQLAIECFTGLPTQRLQVRALRVGHRFITSFRFVRIALQPRLSGIIR
jgi:hypothetical protein